jgi:hypothetical protein
MDRTNPHEFETRDHQRPHTWHDLYIQIRALGRLGYTDFSDAVNHMVI